MDNALGIIGYGIVGQAVEYGFKGEPIYRYDKFKDLLSLKEVCEKSEFIFVCVPTPIKEDESGIDLSIVEEVVGEIAEFIKGSDKQSLPSSDGKIIVIKSTVVPGTTDRLSKKYPDVSICFNPEFLTEANFLEDFVNSDRCIIGANNDLVSRRLVALYKKHFPKMPIYQTDSTTAEMVKYMANCYLATKVTFANEMYDICQKLGISYPEVKKFTIADHRIFDSHLDVTTERGFGGKCLAPDERVFAFNSSKLKVIKAKNLNNQVVGVLGWKDGEIIKDDLIIAGTRRVNNLLKFSLSKGRSVTVTSDHIMIVSDRDGNLSQKEAFEVGKDDYIPVVLDGFKETIKPDHQIIVRLYQEVDLSKHKVFVENLPKSNAEMLKPYLTFNQYKSFSRNRVYCTPLEACLNAGINIDSYRFKTNKTGTLIPAAIMVNADFARLVGYYLSEGCVSNRRVFFSFSFKEEDLIEDVKKILTALNIQFSSRIGYWNDQESSLTIKVSSPILAAYFSKFGVGSNDKMIPYFIFHSGQEIKDNLLAGVLRGDGSIFLSNQGNYWTVNLSTTSQILAEGVDSLLREKGILASIGTVKTAKTKSYAWSLDISENESIRKLVELFTPRQRAKINRIRKRSIKSPAYSRAKNLALLPIKEIEDIRKPSVVYSIETRNHYYITSWGILTHNCFPKDLLALKALANQLGSDTTLLDAVWKKNLKIRKVKDWEEIPFAVTKQEKR